MDVATLDGGEIVATQARSSHRYQTRTGAVEHSVSVRQVGQATVSVFIDPIIAKHATYVHEGTRAHTIRPVARGSLRWASRGEFFYARSVRHPGTKADPFLYNAADSKKAEVLARLQEGVHDAIAEAGLA